jgi:hypothetical protein
MADATETSSDPWGAWRGRITASRARRDQHIGDWQTNVRKRKGTSGNGTAADSTSVSRRTASRSIRTPHSLKPRSRSCIRRRRKSASRRAAISIRPPSRSLLSNSTTPSPTNVGGTIEEILADVVNAAGIGAVVVSYTAKTEPKLIPAEDPMVAAMSGRAPEMVTVDDVVDCQYLDRAHQPADLLIPSDFTGSDYDKARWLGMTAG